MSGGPPSGKGPQPILTSPDANGYYSANPGHPPGGALHNSFGRDPDRPRGRGPGLPSAPNLNVQKDRDLSSRTLSPRAGPNSATEPPSRPGTSNGTYLERQPPGHFRQGSAQKHSRDNSLAGGGSSAGVYGSFRGQLSAGSAGDHDFSGSPDTSEYRSASAFGGYHTSAASSSTLVNSERSGSISEQPGSAAHTVSPQRLDGKPDGKQRREHLRNPSNKTNPDLRSVGEYALHHLFNSFVGKADFKINQCVASIPETVARVEDICGPGVDKDFDSLISALGHIARQKPKHLVDTIMYWRKAKSEEFQAAQTHWNTVKASNPYFRTQQRRNNDSTGSGPDTLSPVGGDDRDPAQAALKTAEINVHQTDRKLSLSIYLICRVLIEVYQQSDLQCITTALDDRLEDLIFDQLHRLDPARVEASPYHYANWTIYGQLLGVMSTLNFPKVSRRFTNVLKSAHDELAPKGTMAHEPEARLELLIRAMNYLSIDAFPEMRWIDSCEFMCNLARFFANSHGQMVKHAYCDVMERLVFPVASTTGPHVLNPRWKEFLNLMNNRLAPMLVKPKHWGDAFSLSTLLLCASPGETFTSLWLSTITGLQAKLKDRTTRPIALQSICRIVWAYLRRSSPEPIGTMRKLEDVVKIVLPSGKKTYLSTDPAIADPIIEFIRIIGFYYPEFAFKAIIFPLMNSELYNTNKEIKTEQLEPERIVVGIRAFLAVISDLEKPSSEKKPPQLPSFDKGGRTPDDPPQQRSANYLGQFDRRRSFMPSEEMLSKSVNLTYLDDHTREYFTKFCEILGKVTMVCDHTFGGQATLDEKFSGQSGQTPKTPITDSFSFSRQKEETTLQDYRQSFYELLHVAVQALPRCLTKDVPLTPLISLLCTGTAHIQSHIATSSARSLKAIARQMHAQQVTMGFARFIFNFDIRYSTMSDEGLLGPGHIESTLQLYLELLKIWIEEIRRKSKQANSLHSPEEPKSSRGLQLDLTSLGAQVEELESHGIFFLCSQSRRVRGFAISVLRTITEFDEALGQTSRRVIHILEGDVCDVISPDDEHLTTAEKARLQKSKRKGGEKNTLIELCCSDVSYDATLWSKIFPNLMRMMYDQCYAPVTLGRDIVCARLMQMQPIIRAFSEGTRSGQAMNMYDKPLANGRFGTAAPEIVIEQWKIYLIMACTTLRVAGGQTQNELAAQHARSKSRAFQKGQEKIGSARSLFATIIPLLNSIPLSIRDAIVIALGSITKHMYRTLLESLQYAVTTCNEEARMRGSQSHQRSGSGPRPRDRRTDLLRTEVTHVYKLTSKFLKDPEVLRDEWIVANLVKFTDDMRIYLNDSETQMDWETQTLRKHYCGLLEEVFEGINRTAEPSRWISFESRKAAFMLVEDWCGYSPHQTQINAREDGIKFALNQQNEAGDRTNVASQMEVAKRDLRMAALSAMSSLCSGPVSVHLRSQGTSLSFDVQRIMDWIDQLFSAETDKIHLTGRRALKNITVHNATYPHLLEHAIDRCFSAQTTKALESYFESVFMVLSEEPNYPVPFYHIVTLVLFMLGNDKSVMRTKAARLLRSMEDREQRKSKLQDFDISIADKTTAVYKNAQYLISSRLASQHPEMAFSVFSQFCFHYRTIHNSHQRNMIQAILPWLNTIELEHNQEGGPSAQSYMLLVNLLEITTKASTTLHNEMQGLWSALASGPAGNVQVILDFVISLCLDRREQSFVDCAKQIVVFLSSTAAGQKVVEFLLLQITPKNMVHVEKKPLEVPPEVANLPYVAELSEFLPIGNKQSGLALGQLSLILLVDLMVSPVNLNPEQIPVLLQICTVLWDHYTPLVQEEAREMLVHLIHELVITQIDDDTTEPSKETIEDLVEAVRQSKPNVVWTYQENNNKDDEDEGMRVPSSMSYLTNEVINLFSIAYPNVHEQWAKTTLSWATSCPVRHLACRSFQLFRCILTSLDQPMLADMLARLSNTVADETPEVQTFSMEILTTLRTVIGALDPANLLKYPQLFWVTCACLNTVNELEFIETIGMLDVLLMRVNLSDPAVIRILVDAKPAKWEGEFDGIMPLVYRGLRSGNSIEKTISVLNKTVALPDSDLIGGNERLLFILLANLPSFLREFDPSNEDKTNHSQIAENLANAMESEGFADLADVLLKFMKSRFNTAKELLDATAQAVRRTFFPTLEFKSLVFLIGLLTNKLEWFKLNTLEILRVFIPIIDMRSQDVAAHGPDLISPLLRLLQTEYCPQALQVMDLIMTMNATPMEKHHLRMSMVMSGSTRQLRKEYERTQSLYGIPEETGWSIPMPAIHSNNTRINVHAVFYTCAGPTTAENEPVATPEIEFDPEDYSNNSYFPPDRIDTMLTEDARMDSASDSLSYDSPTGDLASKLKSLDDFFDEDEDDGGDDKYLSRYSDMTITAYSPDPDSGANLYDEQTAPILNKSLARTASVTSLQNPYSDIRAPGVMNPGAFSSNAQPPSQPGSGTRPGLHMRSITSPSNQFSAGSSRGDVSESENDREDGVFSDDERSAGYSSPPMFDTAVRRTRSTTAKKITGSNPAKEYRQGDLLRGSGRLRSKSQAPGSPEVPKVPEAYLNLGKSDS